MSSSFLIGLIDSVFKDSSFFDDMELRFKSISDEDLAIMKKILSVEKDNYALLTDDSVTKRKIRKRDD